MRWRLEDFSHNLWTAGLLAEKRLQVLDRGRVFVTDCSVTVMRWAILSILRTSFPSCGILFGATLPHRGEPVWPIHAEAVAVPVQCDKNGHDVALIHLLRQRER